MRGIETNEDEHSVDSTDLTSTKVAENSKYKLPPRLQNEAIPPKQDMDDSPSSSQDSTYKRGYYARELDDAKRRLDAALKRVKHGHEVQVERDSWKSKYETCKSQLDVALSQLEELRKSNAELRDKAEVWQERHHQERETSLKTISDLVGQIRLNHAILQTKENSSTSPEHPTQPPGNAQSSTTSERSAAAGSIPSGHVSNPASGSGSGEAPDFTASKSTTIPLQADGDSISSSDDNRGSASGGTGEGNLSSISAGAEDLGADDEEIVSSSEKDGAVNSRTQQSPVTARSRVRSIKKRLRSSTVLAGSRSSTRLLQKPTDAQKNISKSTGYSRKRKQAPSEASQSDEDDDDDDDEGLVRPYTLRGNSGRVIKRMRYDTRVSQRSPVSRKAVKRTISSSRPSSISGGIEKKRSGVGGDEIQGLDISSANLTLSSSAIQIFGALNQRKIDINLVCCFCGCLFNKRISRKSHEQKAGPSDCRPICDKNTKQIRGFPIRTPSPQWKENIRNARRIWSRNPCADVATSTVNLTFDSSPEEILKELERRKIPSNLLCCFCGVLFNSGHTRGQHEKVSIERAGASGCVPVRSATQIKGFPIRHPSSSWREDFMTARRSDAQQRIESGHRS